MSVMNKPDYKIFAQDAKSGEYVAFPDILRGWGITLEQYNGFPPMELFNSTAKRIDEWLMYLTQRGLPEWDAVVDYPKDAMIQHAGLYYVSLKATKGEQPNNSQTSWKKLTEVLGVDGKLAKDQNGADIPDKPKFIENLGLPELLNEKFDKTGGTIKAISDAINIQTEWSQSGYFQISGEDGRTIHQLGKISYDNGLALRNVAEDGTLTVSGDGARFNGRLLGFINEALSSGNGWWRDSSTGFLIQWGETPPGSDTRQVKFPIPFKEWPHAVVHFDGGWFNNGGATWGAVNKSLTGFTGKTSVAIEGGAFIAMGF